MAHDIFISHSSKDKTVADATCALLESRGIRCWIAPRDIRPGDDWGSAIIRAIRASRVMVLIFSSHANASPQIKREVERAVNAGVTVIPMRIEDVMPQESLDYFLGTPHWLDAFIGPLDHHLERLSVVINDILEIPVPAAQNPASEEVTASVAKPDRRSAAPPASASAPQPPPPKPSGKGWLIALGLVLLITVGALGYYFGVASPAQKERQAEVAKEEADAKAATAEAEKEKAEAAAAQARSDEEKNALEKAKLDAEARATAAEQAALQARVEADKAKQAATTAPASGTGPVTGQPWTNSLGVRFVPAGTDGVLFSVWDVRVKDYAAFVAANPGYDAGTDWESPGWTQTDDCPVVNVSWNDAHAFCAWLTKKEQGEGKLGPNQSYRLPTDAEWSKAVGLNESAEGTPASKDGKITGVYPWGTQYPPPQGVGNYDESISHDGYAHTSPVGSFAANQYGLYDMGGNVWQWCEDWYDTTQQYRVLRGASWSLYDPQNLLSSCRDNDVPGLRGDFYGFRVVVVCSP